MPEVGVLPMSQDAKPFHSECCQWYTTMKKILSPIGKFLKKSSEDSLPAYAAQATFFVILSFFPFIILLILLTSRFSFANTDLSLYILDLAPAQLSDYILYVINDITYSNSTSFTIVTVIVSLWSSAKGMQTLAVALDRIYKVQKRSNFILLRVLCALYTFIFMILLLVTISVHAFSGPIAHEIASHFPEFINEASFILSMKSVFTFLVIFVFLLLIYYQLPGRKGEMRHEAIGAAIASLLWMLMTKLFSLYIANVAVKSTMYGSLTSIILIIIWLYIGLQIVLYGAEINYFMTEIINKRIRRHKAKRRLKRDIKIAKKKRRLAKKHAAGEPRKPDEGPSEDTVNLMLAQEALRAFEAEIEEEKNGENPAVIHLDNY